MSTQRAHLEIMGMSCATCSGTVQEAVTGLDGVEAASVNFATDEGTVTYDPEAVSLGEIYAAVEGSTIAATSGILFTGADILERVRDVDVVVFDKTGTLTHGEMELTDVEVVAGDGVAADGGVPTEAADGGVAAQPDAESPESEFDPAAVTDEFVLQAAASAETDSEHPLGEAIVEGAADRGVDTPSALGPHSAVDRDVIVTSRRRL